MLGVAPILLLAGCGDPCHVGPGVVAGEGDVQHVATELVAAEGRIAADVQWPAGGDSFGAFPVVVMAAGGFSPSDVADGAELAQPRTTDGLVSVTVDLAGPAWGDGTDDRRGPLARAALAAALAYAAGLTDDADQCRITTRDPRAQPDTVVLAGVSNGGNLAVATLADAALDLPPLAGLVLWETPAGAEFVNIEHANHPKLYTPGSCRLGEEGVACPFSGVPLVVNADGAPCFDIDGDGGCGEPDVVPPAVTDPATGLHVPSPTLARLAEGLPLVGYASADEAVAFWAERDAARLAPALVAAWPDLPVELLATEVDHVLAGLPDHPHVYGLGEALQAAGAPWVRLNPGTAWTGLDDENPINAPLSLDDAEGWTFPEESAREDQLSAAVRELVALPDGG